jgi:protein phosphatase
MFSTELIQKLCEEVEEVIKKQPILLRVQAPIKIFGDIHGQYKDLMKFFDLYGCPTNKINGGDIDSNDYLFLGDYVDRGTHSLETLCLLFALKCKYPDRIHMIRGNHEDKYINNNFGFADECRVRLGEDPFD